MLVHWIWLATRPHVSDRVRVELVRRFQDPEAVYFADADSYLEIEGLRAEGRTSLADKNLREAEQILRTCRKKDLKILTYRDAAYPSRLKNIPDPPLVFYYKGRLPDFDTKPLIGVVGTRKASAYGLNIAGKMGYQIARCGGIVVSGMADGIDGMATRGALTAGVPAVGVLGCGADVIYPLKNRALYEDMEQYGCLLSEFVPGTAPLGKNFPKRNRIISGLSCGVLVVEAPERSGALITAQAALDQGRDVFVVPGNIDVDTSAGSNRLLRDGAIAVGSGWDIMSEYASQFPDCIQKPDLSVPSKAQEEKEKCGCQTGKNQHKVMQKAELFGNNPVSKQKEDKKVIDNSDASPYSGLEDRRSMMLPDEQKILAALTWEPRPIDDVIAETGISSARMLATLTLLQVKGMVQQHPGKHISLK